MKIKIKIKHNIGNEIDLVCIGNMKKISIVEWKKDDDDQEKSTAKMIRRTVRLICCLLSWRIEPPAACLLSLDLPPSLSSLSLSPTSMQGFQKLQDVMTKMPFNMIYLWFNWIIYLKLWADYIIIIIKLINNIIK